METLNELQKEIEKILSQFHNPAIGCSFGMDSLVVLHLCLQVDPNILMVWNNTLVEYPDTVRFAKQLTKEWKLNLIETKPCRSFWSVIEEYGFPLVRRGDKKNRKAALATEKCCAILKKQPMMKVMKEKKIDLVIDGLRRMESWNRRLMKIRFRFNKTWNVFKFHPLLDWTYDDVWEYIRKNKLPYNSLYDKKLDNYQVHTGCWCCTLGARYNKGLGMAHLHKYYPKLWNYLYIKKGFGKVVFQHRFNPDFFVNENNLEGWLRERPCLFFQF
ncbi:Phosphoadenosine phosphosulfate reductase [subsurface metagenome]